MSCPDWLKKAYIKAVGEKCERCGCVNKLHIHRMVRGNKGGTYKPSNCKVLCGRCHRLMHSGEF